MNNLKHKLNTIIEHLKNEIASLRTGRATSALVEDIEVQYYGSKTPLKAVAAISTPDPKQLVIQPWDKNAIQPIEKAIQSSQLGLQPVTDKDKIRISIPPLTEERRRELAKLLGKSLEEARIKIRQEREAAMRDIDKREKAKEISEDEKFRERQEIQKQIDEVNKVVEDIGAAKEKEIMVV